MPRPFLDGAFFQGFEITEIESAGGLDDTGHPDKKARPQPGILLGLLSATEAADQQCDQRAQADHSDRRRFRNRVGPDSGLEVSRIIIRVEEIGSVGPGLVTHTIGCAQCARPTAPDNAIGGYEAADSGHSVAAPDQFASASQGQLAGCIDG